MGKLKIISHRGNLHGPESSAENKPEVIDAALKLGYDCEIDLRSDANNNYFLGHDAYEYRITFNWLIERKGNIWIHCKNFNALISLKREDINLDLNYFWHQDDHHTLTSKNIIWSFPGQPINGYAVCVLPEKWIDLSNSKYFNSAYGVCTDYPVMYKKIYEESTN